MTAPEARMTVERPAAGQPPGTIGGQVLVDVHLAGNTYGVHATSWPSGGLPSAGTVVPAVGALGGPRARAAGRRDRRRVPAAGSTPARQDSICREDPAAPAGRRRRARPTRSASLPFAYEVGEPPAGAARARRDDRPARRRVVQRRRGEVAASPRPDAERWRQRGWRTVNATYRACAASVDRRARAV